MNGQLPSICVFIDENLEENKVGILSVVRPYSLQQIMSRIRERHRVWDEVKWSKTSRIKADLYREWVDLFFWYKAVRLNVVSINSTKAEAILRGLNRAKSYCRCFGGIFLDWHTTPKKYKFEEELERAFTCECVMRLDSKSTDILQLTDLMMNVAIKARSGAQPASAHKQIVLEAYLSKDPAEIGKKVFFS